MSCGLWRAPPGRPAGPLELRVRHAPFRSRLRHDHGRIRAVRRRRGTALLGIGRLRQPERLGADVSRSRRTGGRSGHGRAQSAAVPNFGRPRAFRRLARAAAFIAVERHAGRRRYGRGCLAERSETGITWTSGSLNPPAGHRARRTLQTAPQSTPQGEIDRSPTKTFMLAVARSRLAVAGSGSTRSRAACGPCCRWCAVASLPLAARKVVDLPQPQRAFVRGGCQICNRYRSEEIDSSSRACPQSWRASEAKNAAALTPILGSVCPDQEPGPARKKAPAVDSLLESPFGLESAFILFDSPRLAGSASRQGVLRPAQTLAASELL